MNPLSFARKTKNNASLSERNRPVADAAAAAIRRNVTEAPVTLGNDPAAGRMAVKVDVAARLGSHAIVAGWATGPITPSIQFAEQTDLEVVRYRRPDVAAHFGLPNTVEYGFVLIAQAVSDDFLFSCVDGAGKILLEEHITLGVFDELDESQRKQLTPAILGLISKLEPFGPEWKELVSRIPAVAQSASVGGYLESAILVEGTLDVAVAGWVAIKGEGEFWLEDDTGNAYSLHNAYWRDRDDVFQAVGDRLGVAALHSGFVAHLPVGRHTKRMVLKVLTAEGVQHVGEVACNTVPADPVAASRWLFGVTSLEGEHEPRFDRVEHPLISRLIDRRKSLWDEFPIKHYRLGQPLPKPQVSIIVPLYGRYDFVESQMLEWAGDPWVREHAQLIYVIDDPALARPFRAHADELYRLYGIPFEWVWGGVNRGFSGANNLGASLAVAPYLLFLNSDVFPQQSGWLKRLIEVLESRPEIGIVAPRLTFAEGGIQHAGMRFERLDEFDVWINHHPYMGLDPALDPQHDLTKVPAVTGACMLLRREDFDAVGGWDTGYLIGDFEDSDLCLKLRAAGKKIAYCPDVQLTHLERQSVAALGAADFRMRVTLWNAMRHQKRWRRAIESAEEAA